MSDAGAGDDSSWSLGGQAAVLVDAAATLRAAAAEPGRVPVSREFAFNAVAKLLETIGQAIDRGTPLPHELVDAGSEIARHIRRYGPDTDG
jgi:hypothetical protein